MARGSTSQPEWASRIVGQEDVPPDQLLANPRNWRVHPKAQQDALTDALDQVGWVQRVVVNKTTGNLVDGHLRVEMALSRGAATVPVTYVELTEQEEGLVLASLDPIGAMASTDNERLRQLLAEVEFDSKDLQAAIATAAGLSSSEALRYTDEIVTPHYEPTGERPAVSELFDSSKALALIREVDAAGLPEELEDFLTLAAYRHVVFDYRKIAEAYAHASPEVQRLFEASALVILDLDDAIERGYVKLRETIAALESMDRDA